MTHEEFPQAFAGRSGRSHHLPALVLSLSMAACGGDDAATQGNPSTVGDGGNNMGAGGNSSVAAPEPVIPAATEACPTLATGNITVKGQAVQLWVGERREDVKGPVMFYWHGTGSVSVEASAFMATQIDEVVQEGGMVASFSTSTGAGDYTGPFVWYSGDLEMVDTLLACAVEQLNIDKRRIYTGGCSAGGLQASYMVYARSSYVAAAMPNSGGTGVRRELQDPAHVPAVITTHGAPGADVVVVDFSVASAMLADDLTSKGGFVVNCNHGGGHCGATAEVVAAQWQFLKDHPFGVSPEPYASGLPASFPSYCEIAQPAVP